MKSLILYYSYRGNTQRIAERIHSAIGGDIARIDTVVPYTGSYDDVVAQGEQEVKRGFLPELKAMDIDLDRYDTIVLGTPVWWYTCAPATRAFLTAHDLSGKTVYPFATNGGWLGRTLKDVAALCPGADVKPGLDVHFDDTTLRTPDKTIDRWIAATTAPAAAGGKTLVVYFSATGSTKTAAEAIAAATGGDLLELEPAEPYTSADLDYNNAGSRVSREHDDETLRDVALKTTTADNWADYDTVYIGYPIWWGIAAWPVDTFVKANDFTGKTVIPFCTSASSGIGESGAQLAALAGTGDWQEGQRFPSAVTQQEVTDWVKSLGK